LLGKYFSFNLLEMLDNLLYEDFFFMSDLLNGREQVHVFNEALVEVVHVQLQAHQGSLDGLELVGGICWLVVDVEQDVLEGPPVRNFAVPQDLGAAVSLKLVQSSLL